jgi:DNA polymerase IIIc chi subunit
MKTILTIMGAVSALVSGALWLKSAHAHVPHHREPDGHASGTDFYLTAQAQARWNKRAALASAVSAMFQAIAFMT